MLKLAQSLMMVILDRSNDDYESERRCGLTAPTRGECVQVIVRGSIYRVPPRGCKSRKVRSQMSVNKKELSTLTTSKIKELVDTPHSDPGKTRSYHFVLVV